MRLVSRLDIGQCHPKLSLAPVSPGNWRPYNFHISPDRLEDGNLFDSCVAPPSRYLLEMYRRISREQDDPQGRLFLVNPLPLLRKDETLVILAVLRRLETEAGLQETIVVLRDKGNMPLGYLLPRVLIDDARFLVLLSCSDAALDTTALGTLYACAATTRGVDIQVSLASSNGFYGGKYLRPFETCCRHASEVLKARWGATGAQDGPARRACRDSIPVFAFISHHAGDVLFASLAARLAPGIFQGLVIHRDYAAICRQVGLPIELLEFAGPVVHRGAYRREDPEHFMDVFPSLPADRFYLYARTSRDYNCTDHHLIDHYAFVLGRPMAAAADLDGGQPLSIPSGTSADAPLAGHDSIRILLHFDAGWRLKIYPPEWQQRLVALLLQRGYAPTLLDASHEIPGCRYERFESLTQFETLIEGHRLLIGMDSFPAHYASLVRQFPTLCLFASTHPVHSRTAASPRYQWLCKELDCAPCRADNICPRYGGEVCRNFVPPEEVCRHVDALLASSCASAVNAPAMPAPARDLLNPQAAEFRNLPSAHLPQRLRLDRRDLVRLDPNALNYRRLYRNYRIVRALRSLLRALGLVTEYFAAVRDQGFWHANSLTREYLMRIFSRVRKPDGR